MSNLPTENRPFDRDFLRARWKNPPILSHLKHLTTRFGLVQHTRKKRHALRFGYSIDDQARGLIVCHWYANSFGAAAVNDVSPIYLRYLSEAQLPTGRFHNFRDARGHFLDTDGGDDPLGRSMWALGMIVGQPDILGLRELALPIYAKARSNLFAPSKLWTRCLCYGLLGAQAAKDRELVPVLVAELMKRYRAQAKPDWPWFEQTLRYANGIFSYALLMADESRAHPIGLGSLVFLNQISRVGGVPAPIGNRGWYPRGGERAIYDQQCLEAADMVLANAAAAARTGDRRWYEEAEDWYAWFWGYNRLRAVLVTADGGCLDGIGAAGTNPNQGAESTLAYLMTHLALVRLAAAPPTVLKY